MHSATLELILQAAGKAMATGHIPDRLLPGGNDTIYLHDKWAFSQVEIGFKQGASRGRGQTPLQLSSLPIVWMKHPNLSSKDLLFLVGPEQFDADTDGTLADLLKLVAEGGYRTYRVAVRSVYETIVLPVTLVSDEAAATVNRQVLAAHEDWHGYLALIHDLSEHQRVRRAVRILEHMQAHSNDPAVRLVNILVSNVWLREGRLREPDLTRVEYVLWPDRLAADRRALADFEAAEAEQARATEAAEVAVASGETEAALP